MKRFILAITAIIVIGLWFAPLAQAVTVNGERQVGASQQPTYTKSESYQQPVVAPVAYQQPVPEVTAKQFDALRARVKDLEKKQATQATKIAEANTAATDAKVIGNQAVEKAKEANGKADKNNGDLAALKSQVDGHERWLKALSKAYNKTALTVSGLLDNVKKIRDEIKQIQDSVAFWTGIAAFAGVLAGVCLLCVIILFYGRSKNPKEEPKNFKK